MFCRFEDKLFQSVHLSNRLNFFFTLMMLFRGATALEMFFPELRIERLRLAESFDILIVAPCLRSLP